MNIDMLAEYLEYDEASPSGLRWKVDRSNGAIKAGTPAGTMLNTRTINKYWLACFNGKRQLAHRLVWALHHGVLLAKNAFIDHIDGNGLNNVISNLRVVDVKTNGRNRKRTDRASTLPPGVRYYENSGVGYRAQVMQPNGKLASKSFSKAKYGDAQALALAVQ